MTIVHDRTKTVVRRHIAPGEVVSLHPEAVGFAGHYDFDIDVLAACRPAGKGRVERQVLIVRDQIGLLSPSVQAYGRRTREYTEQDVIRNSSAPSAWPHEPGAMSGAATAPADCWHDLTGCPDRARFTA